ncbi:MAG: chromate resistance protein ChrB domain-containing protein [Candidatus Eiseniibacteriota bacterium]
MSSATEVSVPQLSPLVGTPGAPEILDVRTDEAFAKDPRLIAGAQRRDARTVEEWAPLYSGRRVVVACLAGQERSHGVASWLRQSGAQAQALEGGFNAWREAGGPLVDAGKLPRRDALGRTVWVTRARPKIDRIACPWLVRRFIDPHAVFLFVPSAQVASVAETFQATPFDVEGVFWSHRGEHCTFDTMLEELGLEVPALRQLALIVRAADTARMDVAPEAAGLLAVSVGLSRLYQDDLQQLEATLAVYDALYLWVQGAADDTHNRPSLIPASA